MVAYFGDVIDENILQSITRFNYYINQLPFDGFIETVPAYVSLTIYYDPVKVLANASLSGNYAFERVINYLKDLPVNDEDIPITSSKPIIIPVCYGETYGPDIEEVARHNKLTIEEVIYLHSQPTYIVYMLGFLPGFPYMGGMNKSLATPRKKLPRKAVPVGSVGIAGEQTGIYPLQSPGGWQLIGRTPVNLFNPYNDSPTLLKAGDRIQFSPISESEFKEISH